MLVATTCQIAIMSFASVSFYSQHIHNKFFSRLRLYFYFSSSLCSTLYYHTPYRFVQIICVLFVVADCGRRKWSHIPKHLCDVFCVFTLFFLFLLSSFTRLRFLMLIRDEMVYVCSVHFS